MSSEPLRSNGCGDTRLIKGPTGAIIRFLPNICIFHVVNKGTDILLSRYWEKAEFPFDLVPGFAKLMLPGGGIKGYGCSVSDTVIPGHSCTSLLTVTPGTLQIKTIALRACTRACL